MGTAQILISYRSHAFLLGLKVAHPSGHNSQCCRSFKRKVMLLRSSFKITKQTINFSQAVGSPGFFIFTVVWNKSIAEARQNVDWSLSGRLVNSYEKNMM